MLSRIVSDFGSSIPRLDGKAITIAATVVICLLGAGFGTSKVVRSLQARQAAVERFAESSSTYADIQIGR